MAYVLVPFLGQESGVEGLGHPEPCHLPCKHLSWFWRGEKNCGLLSSPWWGKGLWRAIGLTHLSLELSGLQHKTPAESPPSGTTIPSCLPVITGQRLPSL